MSKLFFLYAFVFCTNLSISQSANWYARLDKEVGVNTAFQVEFVLENEKGGSFVAPDFGGLQVLSGPMYSSSTQIINGRASSSISYVFNVIATKEGVYDIGPASIVINRKKVYTKSAKVKVTKGNNIAGLVDGESGDMLIRMELSDSTAYVGQQVMLNYVLYYKGSVRFNGLVKEDEFKGIYAQRIQGTSKTKTMIHNGQKYQSSIVSSIALFPQKSGTFNISPCVVKVGIPVKSNRSRSFFSFQQYDNKVLSANPLELIVNELPEGAPEGFSGAVGEFEFQVGVNKTTTTTDDAIVMHLAVRGNGDIRLLEAPKIKFDQEWEVYEPTIVEEEEFVQNDKIFNYKKFEYLLLPKSIGQLSIQPTFTYFSIDSNDYETITGNPTRIQVTQGNRKVLYDDSKILSDRSLSPLRRESAPLLSTIENPFLSTYFMGSMGLFILIGFGMYWKKRNLDDYRSLSFEERRRLEAVKVAKSSLSKAALLKDKNEAKPFYDEISTAMNGYLVDKYNIPHSDISKHYIKSLLEEKFTNSEIADKYLTLLNQCELALFAGQSGTHKMNEIYELSLSLISEIEGYNKA